jgi:hypothetical protein
MCRSIKQLRPPKGSEQTPATFDEVDAAALQFVRKVGGYRNPSVANEPAFNAAVEEIAEATRRYLAALGALVVASR